MKNNQLSDRDPYFTKRYNNLKAFKNKFVYSVWFTVLLIVTSSSVISQNNCSLPMDSFQSYSKKELFSSSCSNENSNTNPDYTNKYKKIETYIPDINTPIKHIKICINIFTGPGTIQNTTGIIANLNQMVAWSNDFYTHIVAATYPIAGVIPLTDTKIRFDLDDRIYFYNGTNLYNYTSIAALQTYVAGIDVTRLEYLNIYLTAGISSPYAIVPFPITMLNSYYPNAGSMYGDVGLFMHVDGTNGINYAHSQTLAHELGHCLDLFHTYNPSCCHETCDDADPEYLEDVFGPSPPAYCWEYGGWGCTITPGQNTCTNNAMGGNNLINYFFSPHQIGKMHRALSIKTTRRYVRNDAYNSIPLNITCNETWNFDIRLYSNIAIKTGVTLTMKCNTIMPILGKVIVEQGGKLIVDAATFTNATTEQWQGIEVQNGGYLELNSTTMADYSINIKSGGTLRIIGGLTISGNNHIDIEIGGYICVDNDTLNLTDPLSIINLHNGYNLGVNTAFVTNPGTCNSILSSINKIGSGFIYEFNDVFIQNESLTGIQYIPGNNISAGTNVTNSKPQGPVVIKSGANVVFDADCNILLDKGFEVELGATFEAK